MATKTVATQNEKHVKMKEMILYLIGVFLYKYDRYDWFVQKRISCQRSSDY